MSPLATLLLPFVLAASPDSRPDPSVDRDGYFSAIRRDLVEDLQVPLTPDARKQRAARREKTQKRVGPPTKALAKVRPSLFASASGVFADTLGVVRSVEGEPAGTFEVPVAPDLFPALGDFAGRRLLGAKEAEAFNQRVRTEVGQALDQGSVGKSVVWSPAGLESLELLLIGRAEGKEYLRRAAVLAVEVRVRQPCCEEPPFPQAYLRVRFDGGLPGKPDGSGTVEMDAFYVLLAADSPAATRLRKLPAAAIPRITRTPEQPTYLSESSLDLDLDGVPDVASSHRFDCIDESCRAIYLNVAGRWTEILLEDERICAGGC